jgi:membrane protease YdiL (CAAX protease family)
MRRLVPVEVAAFLAVAFAPWPLAVPIAMPLIAVATLARLLRGHSWGELMHGRFVLAGTCVGLAALAIALIVGTPLIESATAQQVQWAQYPMVRHDAGNLIALILLVAAMSGAMELALRGWIVDRALDFMPPAAAILVGAGAEALLADGTTERIGAAIFGAGLGWMYVASGRNLAVSLCARLAFALGCVLLESARLIG